MLAKPFAVMSSRDWDKAPQNTNGVERANSLSKSGGNKQSLFASMQSLYERDKMFALQHISAAENGSKISYRDTSEEICRAQSYSRRKSQQYSTDKRADFGPPDKTEHFSSHTGSDKDVESVPQTKKTKSDDQKNVEVL